MSALTVSEGKEMYETAVQRMLPRWQHMLLCYDMLLGRQWEQEEADYHKKWSMTMRTLNMLHSIMVTFDGVAIDNILKAKAYPIEPGDFELSDVLSEVLQDSMRQCEADYELRQIMDDAAICGWGWGYCGFRRSERFKDGEAYVERMNGFDGLADLDDENPAVQRDRWRGMTRWGTPAFFSQSWGAYDPEVAAKIDERISAVFTKEEDEKIRSGWYSVLQRAKSNLERVVAKARGVRSDYDVDARMRDYIDKTAGMVRGIEIHYRRQHTRKAIADPYQERPIQIPEQYQKDRETIAYALSQLQLDESAIIDIPVDEWRVAAFLPGLIEDEAVFDVPYTVQGRGPAIKIFEAFAFDTRKNERTSLIALGIDAQRRLNRNISLMEEMQKRRMYPDWLIPKGSIHHDDVQTWKSNAMARTLEYNADPMITYGQGPQRLDAPAVEGLLSQDFALNVDLIPRLTGVPLALGGEKDAKKDGADLYQSMVAQGQTMVKPLLKNQERFFKEVSGFILSTIQRHYTAQRFIRLTGKNGLVDPETGGYYINAWDFQQDRPVNDIDSGFYDISLDSQYISPVQREAKFAQRTQMMAMFDPMLRDFSFPEWVELSGWADAPDLLRKWRVTVIIKYAPYGELILQMLEDEDAFQTAVQNGDITQAMMAGAMAKLQQGGGMAGLLPAGGMDTLTGARDGVGYRQAEAASVGAQPQMPGVQQIMDGSMVAGNSGGAW